MTQEEQIGAYIGKKWEANGRGPTTFDCWGLVWHVYKHVLNKDLPLYAFYYDKGAKSVCGTLEKASQSANWKQLQRPVPFSIVALSQHKIIHHVGIYLNLDGGLILHALKEASFVVAQGVTAMRTQGWNRIEFYEYRQHTQ